MNYHNQSLRLKRATILAFFSAALTATVFSCSGVRGDAQGKETVVETQEVIQYENEVRLTAGVVRELNEILTATPYNETAEASRNIVDKVMSQPVTEETEIENSNEQDNNVEEEISRPNKHYYIYEPSADWECHLDTVYQDYLYQMCEKYDVVEYYTLFLAQMYHESNFKVDVISRTNDYGLMQINVCNHDWLGDILGSYDFLDPYTNIEAGVYLMSDFLHKYNDVQKALVCYNRGESAVRNKGIYTTDYSKCVVADMELLVEIE